MEELDDYTKKQIEDIKKSIEQYKNNYMISKRKKYKNAPNLIKQIKKEV